MHLDGLLNCMSGASVAQQRDIIHRCDASVVSLFGFLRGFVFGLHSNSHWHAGRFFSAEAD